jgi:uncharacterized membrane protein
MFDDFFFIRYVVFFKNVSKLQTTLHSVFRQEASDGGGGGCVGLGEPGGVGYK